VVVAPRFFVYPGYKSIEDEPKIRQLIYKGLKDIETEIRKRMLNSDNVEELGRALKAINMIAVRVKSTEGRPTSKKDLEQIDAAIFDRLNTILSTLVSKDYTALLAVVSELEKLVTRRNSLFS
jgi:5-carboxymethyl-2-hydroxymuconate isomerase